MLDRNKICISDYDDGDGFHTPFISGFEVLLEHFLQTLDEESEEFGLITAYEEDDCKENFEAVYQFIQDEILSHIDFEEIYEGYNV